MVDNIDRVIWSLPFLAILDVVSTLYVESLGYSLALYEVGFLASLFADLGLLYLYVPAYFLLVLGLACVLWYIKNGKLNPSYLLDKVIFLLLVSVACYVCIRLAAASIGNLLLPYFVSGRVSWFSVTLLVYLSIAFTLVVYLLRDVTAWVTEHDNEEEEQPSTAFRERHSRVSVFHLWEECDGSRNLEARR